MGDKFGEYGAELIALKTCCACGLTKHITEYYDGKGRCKPCKHAAASANRIANPEAYRAACRRYYSKNKTSQQARAATKAKRQAPYYAAKASEYRARQKQATPQWITKEQVREIQALFEEAAARPTPHEVDHIVPLKGTTVCGLHVPWNLRVIPTADNRSKKNKLLEHL